MAQRELKRLREGWQTSLTEPAEDTDGTEVLAKYPEAVARIHQALKAAERVLIVTHEHPDGDAVGSALALLTALRMAGKQAEAFVPDPPPPPFDFLPGIQELAITRPAVSDFDAVAVLDATYFTRTQLAEELQAHGQVIVIDHHFDNQGEGQLNLIVPEAAATAHILTAFFAATQTPITKDMATCLLTGIFTDTGSFMHDSTTPEILKLASFLMRKGARLSHIAHETYQKKELAGLKIWGRALSRIMISETQQAAISVVTVEDLAECGASLDDLSGVVNMLNTLPEANFALLLTEYEPGKIKGSLRSEANKAIDVSAIAKALGGGGHKLAAGFEVPGRLVKQDGQWRVLPNGRLGTSNS